MLGAQYRLDCVVTLVGRGERAAKPRRDARSGEAGRGCRRIVITKSDIAKRGAVAALEARLERMNAFAARTVAVNAKWKSRSSATSTEKHRAPHPKTSALALALGRGARRKAPISASRVRTGAHDAFDPLVLPVVRKPFTWTRSRPPCRC